MNKSTNPETIRKHKHKNEKISDQWTEHFAWECKLKWQKRANKTVENWKKHFESMCQRKIQQKVTKTIEERKR